MSPEPLEDGATHEHRPVGVEHHLLGVEVEGRLAARRQAERAPLEGPGGDEVDEFAMRMGCHRRQYIRSGVHDGADRPAF